MRNQLPKHEKKKLSESLRKQINETEKITAKHGISKK